MICRSSQASSRESAVLSTLVCPFYTLMGKWGGIVTLQVHKRQTLGATRLKSHTVTESEVGATRCRALEVQNPESLWQAVAMV